MDIIKNYDIEEFIEYLKKKDLKFKKIHFKILHKKEITSLAFLELTKEKLEQYSIKEEPITIFIKFIESFNQKSHNYFLYKTLDNLKEILCKNKINEKDITNIKQFLFDK